LFFEDISKNDTIQFFATGTGEASVVFGASFIPASIFTEPVYRGIQVQKIIQRIDPLTSHATGGAIVGAAIGERVIITIQITIPDYSSSIIISDSFPGAIEPFDESIYGSSTSTDSIFGGLYQYSRFNYWYFYFYRAFSVKEFRKDKVVFYGQQLFAGTHTVTYTALVNTEGEFVLPPAHAWDSLQPELMGLSAGGVFTTKAMPAVSFDPSSVECLPWVSRELARASLIIPKPGVEVDPATPQPDQIGLLWPGILLFALGVPLIIVAVILYVLRKRAKVQFQRLPSSVPPNDDMELAGIDNEVVEETDETSQFNLTENSESAK